MIILHKIGGSIDRIDDKCLPLFDGGVDILLLAHKDSLREYLAQAALSLFLHSAVIVRDKVGLSLLLVYDHPAAVGMPDHLSAAVDLSNHFSHIQILQLFQNLRLPVQPVQFPGQIAAAGLPALLPGLPADPPVHGKGLRGRGLYTAIFHVLLVALQLSLLPAVTVQATNIIVGTHLKIVVPLKPVNVLFKHGAETAADRHIGVAGLLGNLPLKRLLVSLVLLHAPAGELVVSQPGLHHQQPIPVVNNAPHRCPANECYLLLAFSLGKLIVNQIDIQHGLVPPCSRSALLFRSASGFILPAPDACRIYHITADRSMQKKKNCDIIQ